MAVTRRAIPRAPSSNGHQALTASIKVAEGRNIDLGYAWQAPWQKLAWDYWARVPELHYPSTQLARLITQMDWDVTLDGTQLERTDGDEPDQVDDFLAAVTESIDEDREEQLRLIALNLIVAAELWYVRRGDDGWKVIAITDPELKEIRERDDDWHRLHVKVVDPRDQRYAMSPFASVIGVAEELLTLEALSRAQSRSRISQAGILLRPQSAQFPTEDDDGNALDPFGDDLMRVMTAPIADEHDPSALVPMDLEVPDDSIDKFRHLVFDRPYDDRLHDRIEQVVKRIAVGLDIPAEVLLGMGDVNHWGQWLINEDMGKNHAVPLAKNVGRVLARAGAAMLDLPEDAVQVTPDPSELFAKRSTVQDAFRALDRGVVGYAYTRDAIGAKPEDAPTPDELDLILKLSGHGDPVAVDGSADDDAGPEVEPVTDEGTPATSESLPVAASLVAAIDPGTATEEELERFGDDLARLDDDLRAELVGAMSMAVRQARRRVGAILISQIRRGMRERPAQQALADAGLVGVERGDEAAVLGARAFEMLDAEEAVRESFDDLAAWWAGTVTIARERLAELAGIDTSTAEWVEAQQASVDRLVDGLTEWTVAQLTRTTAEMHALPTDLIRDVVAVAGGSTASV